MKIGAVFPHQHIGDDPVVIRDWAQAVEGLGYSHILVYDHVVGAAHENREPKLTGPYTEEHAFHEPLMLLSYLAGITQKVELVTSILILPQRQTVLAAKQVAELDILSGERVRLGVGTGWNHVEYDCLNVPFADRGRRQVEQIDLMRKLWSEPIVDYHGEFHRVDRAGLKPRPKRQVPIWFGGWGKIAFRRAAALGDGFIFANLRSTERDVGLLARLREELDKAGRSFDDFGVEAILDYPVGKENWREEVLAWREAGADHIAIRMEQPGKAEYDSMRTSMNTPQHYIDGLANYWEVVGDLAS